MKVVTSALRDRGLNRNGNEDQCLINESLEHSIVRDGLEGYASAERAISFTAIQISAHADTLDLPAKKPLLPLMRRVPSISTTRGH
ncbi:hypothetical protein [uncultured Gimesia sp.]|uniref:hypothetical protein n=1 Tax=uncultured Gimesia sp. TaxID=1678688 RepID=UPI0030DD2382